MFPARALYNNTSDSPEELTFNQGDVLTVIQKDFSGLDGWWLCFLDGRVGLAPGNRLQVVGEHQPRHDGISTENCEQQQQPDNRDPTLNSGVHHSLKAANRVNRNNEENQTDHHHQRQQQQPVYDVPASTHGRNRSTKSGGTISIDDHKLSSGRLESPHRSSPAAPEMIYDVPLAMGENYNEKPEVQCWHTGKAERPSEERQHLQKPNFGPEKVRVCVEDDDDSVTCDAGIAPTPSLKSRDVGENLSSALRGDRWKRDSRVSTSSPGVVGQVPYRDLNDQLLRHSQFSPPTIVIEPSRQSPIFLETGQRQLNKCGNSQTLPKLIVSADSSDMSEKCRARVQMSSISNPRLKIDCNRDSYLEEYSVPRCCSTLPPPRLYRVWNPDESGIGQSSETYDVPAKSMKNPKRVETCPETPRFYDAPSRARDNENSEFQLSFVDTGIYVDCPQDLDSATDLMVSLERTVRCQATRVRELCTSLEQSSFCGSEGDFTQMKLTCLSLRTAVKEFVDLGTGALANAMQSTNKELAETILQQLEQLRCLSQTLASAIDVLIGAQGRRTWMSDSLNTLKTVAVDIVASVSTLTEVIGKNSSLIFSPAKSLTLPETQALVVGVSRECRTPSPITVTKLSNLTGSKRFSAPMPAITGSHLRATNEAERLPFQNRPLPPLPVSCVESRLADSFHFCHQGCPCDVNSQDTDSLLTTDSVDSIYSESPELNDDEHDYVSIANLAEKEMKQKVRLMVGRLADRSRTIPFSALGSECKATTDQETKLPKPELGPSGATRFGGLSPQFKERLDAIRSTTEQAMKITCTRPRQSTPSSPDVIQGYFSDFLKGIDREMVRFYVDQITYHFVAVDSATGAFLRAVTDRTFIGCDLVNLSRDVILAAHKLVYVSDAITKNITDDVIRRQVGAIANELCDRLRETVAASKATATATSVSTVEEESPVARERSMDCMRQVKYLSLRLKDVIFAHLLDKF